jgi:LacI family transcriptional regulator
MQRIADELGVSRMTVSLALRQSPRISEDMRHKVMAAAGRLGYRPNPLVSALMAQVQASRVMTGSAVLAFLTSFPTRDGWRKMGPAAHYFEGAQERAARLGYKLEDWWIREPGMTSHRLTRILYTRNINGLILAPGPRTRGHITLEWRYFAVASLGYSVWRPNVNRTTNNQFASMLLALRSLRRLGYRRIGVALPGFSDDRVNNNWTGGASVYQRKIPAGEQVPMLITSGSFTSPFKAWVRAHKPEAVITVVSDSMDWLTEMGLRVPEDIGYVHLDLSPKMKQTGVAGIDQQAQVTGSSAVDLVVAQLHRNERGIPVHPKLVLTDSVWVEGFTVRRVQGRRGVGCVME